MAKCPFRVAGSWYNAITDGGCHGDGSTDDATHLADAMTAAVAAGKVLYLPPATYRVSTQVSLPDNLNMRGAGVATIVKRDSEADTENCFYVGDVGRTGTNITVSNMKIQATADQDRVGYAGQSSSNVIGLHFMSGDGVTIDHVTFDNLEYGLKVDTQMSNLRATYLTSTMTFRPTFLAMVATGYGSDWDFSFTGLAGLVNKHVYLDDGCTNMVIDRVTCRGGNTWAIQVCANNDIAAAHDIVFNDVTLIGTHDGLVVTDGAYNVTFDGITMTGLDAAGYIFGIQQGEGPIHDVTDVLFNDFTVSGGAKFFYCSAPAGHFSDNITISNGTYTGPYAETFIDPSNVADLTIDNVSFGSMTVPANAIFIYADVGATYGTFTFKNSDMTFATIGDYTVRLKATGATTFGPGNTWTKSGEATAMYVNYNITAGTVTWDDSENTVTGFAGIKHASDTQTVVT